jgi:hypothetical protein
VTEEPSRVTTPSDSESDSKSTFSVKRSRALVLDLVHVVQRQRRLDCVITIGRTDGRDRLHGVLLLHDLVPQVERRHVLHLVRLRNESDGRDGLVVRDMNARGDAMILWRLVGRHAVVRGGRVGAVLVLNAHHRAIREFLLLNSLAEVKMSLLGGWRRVEVPAVGRRRWR